MTKDYSELKQDYVPLTRTIDTTNFSLSKELVYLADYTQLEQRYNLLLDYVKEKTGSCDEEIKRFTIDKWQRANSYWCRYNMDYAFASEKEINESYNYDPPENEEKDLIDKLKKIKFEYLNKYKFSVWYEQNRNEQKQTKPKTELSYADSQEVNELSNELKKAKKTIVDLKTVAEYYKDRYLNVKSIVDYLLNNKFISKQIVAQSKPKKLAEEIEKKIRGLPKYIIDKWELKI
jgi:hypothetical protein